MATKFSSRPLKNRTFPVTSIIASLDCISRLSIAGCSSIKSMLRCKVRRHSEYPCSLVKVASDAGFYCLKYFDAKLSSSLSKIQLYKSENDSFFVLR